MACRWRYADVCTVYSICVHKYSDDEIYHTDPRAVLDADSIIPGLSY